MISTCPGTDTPHLVHSTLARPTARAHLADGRDAEANGGEAVPVPKSEIFLRRLLLVLSLVAAALFVPPASTAGAADPCAPLVNPIACENTKPGTPRSTWDVSGAGSGALQGFTTEMSVNLSETVRFKIKSTTASYRLDIYRMGYYGGNGARLVSTVTPVGLQNQPDCLSDPITGLGRVS